MPSAAVIYELIVKWFIAGSTPPLLFPSPYYSMNRSHLIATKPSVRGAKYIWTTIRSFRETPALRNTVDPKRSDIRELSLVWGTWSLETPSIKKNLNDDIITWLKLWGVYSWSSLWRWRDRPDVLSRSVFLVGFTTSSQTCKQHNELFVFCREENAPAFRDDNERRECEGVNVC